MHERGVGSGNTTVISSNIAAMTPQGKTRQEMRRQDKGQDLLGALDGALDGLFVGASDGALVGALVGVLLGALVTPKVFSSFISKDCALLRVTL